MRHFVLVLAALLRKSTSTVVDPFVTIDLLTAGTAAAAAGTAVVLLVGGGDDPGLAAIEATVGQDQSVAAAGSRGRVDDGIDVGLFI